jgi:hypothetical protein
MARKATLFEETKGNVVEAFLILLKEGKNIPPKWIERANTSRKKREKDLGKLLREGKLDALYLMRDWMIAYQKECFYYGLRVLMELERKGKTEY